MQIFLPYKSITLSAKVLDNKRLNKQILEAENLIFAMYENNNKFYKNHPVRKMWEGHVWALWKYRNEMLEEKISRIGDKRDYLFLTRFNKNTGELKTLFFEHLLNEIRLEKYLDSGRFPDWFYDDEIMEKLCRSHRKSLLIKDFNHYSKHL